jgi:pSer/pThr/pTyr-binding forkhead associated (FHA) protein
VDGSAFPAWVDVGSFGGLACALATAAALAIWSLVYRRGTTRLAALAILICLTGAALMILPIWWDQARFDMLETSLESGEILLMLAWIALFGWALPLGMLASYTVLAEPATEGAAAPIRRDKSNELAAQLALADPARYAPVMRDDVPWAQLDVTSSDGSAGKRTFPLRTRLTLIGREIDNDVVLPHEMVSRHHAEIRFDHKVVVLRDFGSRNGTTINAQETIGPVPLKPGDIIGFGATQFRFTLVQAPDTAYEARTSKMPGANGATRRQSMPPMGPAALVALNSAVAGRRWSLADAVTKIGRDASCQVRLADSTVSRIHAEVIRQSDGYYVSDIGSENGSSVNSAALDAPRRLRNGDVIMVGSVTLRFEAMPLPRESGPPLLNRDAPPNGLPTSRPTVPLARDVAPPPDDHLPPPRGFTVDRQ